MGVVIGIPHGTTIPVEGLIGFERLELPPSSVAVRTFRRPVHLARNEIITTALRACPDASHVFFLDDDMVLPPDALLRLLASATREDAPILTALCTQRSAPFLPCVYHEASNGHYAHVVRFVERGLQVVDACGAAALLVRLDVLRAMQQRNGPSCWFAWAADGFSEDIAFCRAARALGYRIALDPSVQATHIGVLEATYERFEREGLPDLTFASAEIARLAHEVRPW